ncbi:MAG: ATP-binding protein, partial [Halanaeroarchaeum sp.]
GVALAIEHETEQYGILTVHLSPGVGYGSDIAHLLERLVEDLGSYLHLFELANRLETAYEIVERIEDPIMLQDSAGTFELVNQAVVEHAGLDREELLGTDEYAFMDEETAAQIQKYKDRVQSLAETLEYEVSPTFPEKGRKHFATDRYPHYDEDGDIDGTIAICRDVTDLRERERQLRVMDRLLRHNVNNSLNVVIGYAELIEERAQDDTIVESAERIVESGRSLLGTAQNERRISSVLAERPVPEAVDIGDVTRSVIDEGRQSYPDATVEFRAEGEVTAWVPPSVGSAIEELLENALRHSGDPTPHVSVVVSENGDAVSVTVTDTGPAIPPMDRKILTDEMEVHQLEHGTGVGLWLVKLVADLAEGAIEYAETDAGGNRITLILPKQH